MSNQSPHTFVIAEAGVNHNGSLDLACELVRIAAVAGADAVKFQTFKAESIASKSALKAEYQSRNTGSDGSQVTMLKALELSGNDHYKLFKTCNENGIEFMSTPFDEQSASFLAADIGVKRLKIGSGELTNAPLLLHLARTGKPAILSTGMATLEEIKTPLGVLAYGYIQSNDAPESLAAFIAAYASADGQRLLKSNVTLLHCTSDYPAAAETINLKAMETLRTKFALPVGLSDHSRGIAVPAAAVAQGAVVIEKHFTLDRRLEGPDHPASLEPDELTAMIESIRTVEAALGNGAKEPGPAERKTAAVARKSLVALTDIALGVPFTAENLGVKRPGTGISPISYWSYLGKPAARAYVRDELIDPQ